MLGKTTFFRLVLTTFFIFSLRVSGADEAGVTRLASGMELVYERGAERRLSGERLLREIDREVTRLFHAPAVRGGRCRILVSAARPAAEVRLVAGDRRTELLLGDAFDEARGEAFCGDLARAMLLARFAVPAGRIELPYWVKAGLFGVLEAGRSSGKIARNIRYYPVLRALLMAGAPPDFRRLMTMRDSGWTGASARTVRELCRFLLETGAAVSTLSENALGDYVMAQLSGRSREDAAYAATLEARFAGARPGMDAEAFLRYAAERSAFQIRTPRPGWYSLKILPERLSGRGAGEAGSIRSFSASELAGLFARRDAAADGVRRSMLDALAEFGTGVPIEALAEVERVASVLRAWRPGLAEAAAVAEFNAALAKLTAALRRQQAEEALLARTEEETVSPFVLFRGELAEAANDGEAMTRRTTEFLNRQEELYLEE